MARHGPHRPARKVGRSWRAPDRGPPRRTSRVRRPRDKGGELVRADWLWPAAHGWKVRGNRRRACIRRVVPRSAPAPDGRLSDLLRGAPTRREPRAPHRADRPLEVDAHHDTAEGRATDLRKPGRGEDAAAPDVELDRHDLLPRLRDHRVGLEGTGAPLPREVDGPARKRTADSAAPEARAGDEAGDSPDGVVGLVLRSPRPHARLAKQPRV